VVTGVGDMQSDEHPTIADVCARDQTNAGFGCFRSLFAAYIQRKCNVHGITLLATLPGSVMPCCGPHRTRSVYTTRIEKEYAISWLKHVENRTLLPFEQPEWRGHWAFCLFTLADSGVNAELVTVELLLY
jgi:hypothetical protein